MFSSWDLVRPRFWYPMSSLEQSMMELEQMSGCMMRPRFPFDMHREMRVAPTPNHVMYSGKSMDDDDFFVDLPVVAHKYKPTVFQLSENAQEQDQQESNTKTLEVDNKSDTDISTDMEANDDGSAMTDRRKGSNKSMKTLTKNQGRPKDKRHSRSPRRSYKVTPTTTEHTAGATTDGTGHTFSSYSFSNSSVVDEKGRRVATTRRRYEDSTGRLKAVHEREIDGKNMRTTWVRQGKEDEGQHESICSSGSPEEFEALWQQTPFGGAQKQSVKGQLQSESDVEKEVTPVKSAQADTTVNEKPTEAASTETCENVDAVKKSHDK